MNKKITFVLVLAVAALLVMGSASAGLFDFLGGGEDTVTIGYLKSDHDAALFVADAQGQFKDKGINTELVPFNNGGDLMTAMASGDVDVGYAGITPVMASISQGVPAKVISGVQIEGSAIVVTNDSGIESAQDLAGKTIGTPGDASIQHMLLLYYLDQNGLSEDDLNISAMKVPSMVDAINTGNLDGMITFEPYASLAESQGHKVLVGSDEIIPEHPCCVVVASQAFLDEHPDVAKNISEIHANATEFINENIKANTTDKVVELLPDDVALDSDVEVASISQIEYISGLDDDYKQKVMDFMNVEVDLGVLKAPLDEADIFWDGS